MKNSKIKKLFVENGVEDEIIIREYEQKLEDLKKKVVNLENSTNKDLWDATVIKYYQNTNKMIYLLNEKGIKENISENTFKNLDNLLKMCKDPEFHIAFVGAIKAGKSTLINALLGKDLASTAVTPETASLTKFRASKDKNYVKLTFYNEQEWNNLWHSVKESKAETFLEEYNSLNAEQEKEKWINKKSKKIYKEDFDELKKEIKKWTSSKEGTHYFVKEVEVGLKDFNLPEGVVFVDTPGLDDPVKYRSDITRDYIDRANAVLVCVKSDALTGQELRTIYSVFSNSRYNPEKVFIIGTQMDALNRPIDNWKEQREEWLKHLEKKDCYGSRILAEKNLLVTAAYLYNLCINFDDLGEDDIDFELDPIARKFRVRNIEENIDKLKDYTQVENLKNKLNKEIIEKHKKILIKDIESSYKLNKDDIVDIFTKIKNDQIELLNLTNADIEKIKEEKEKNQVLLDNIKKDKEEMEAFLKQIRIYTNERVEALCKEISKIGVK